MSYIVIRTQPFFICSKLSRESSTSEQRKLKFVPMKTRHMAKAIMDWVFILRQELFLMKVKEESEKAGLKPNIQKTKMMASSPLPSWQIGGETMETVTDFLFLGSKITVDGDYSHKIKGLLLQRRKAMTNLDSILKSRDIPCWQRSIYSKLWFFISHIWMWDLDYKPECWRIDAFELWCWRGLLRVSWIARGLSQSILKAINSEHSLQGLMMKLKLKLQYFGYLMWRAESLPKSLILGKIEGRRRSGWQRMR